VIFKLLSIVGARPQFVKAAMIADAIKRHNSAPTTAQIQHVLVHTGQHYEHRMSGVFFDELDLPEPDHHLGVGSGLQGAQTGKMLAEIEKVLLVEKPQMVMVYGDTNSTVAGALAAAKLHIQVAHLEAGLRSFNRRMPEEINRIVSDHISDILFCPTPTALENLRKEGLEKAVFQTGDVMLDALMAYREKAEKGKCLLQKLGVKPKEYALATIHRAENTDSAERLSRLITTLTTLGHPVVLPMHPRVRDRLAQNGEFQLANAAIDGSESLRTIAPVSYLEMLTLELNARVILTDSGGVQKEAFFAGVPCLTLRDETEWLETQQGGWNRLVGTVPDKIRAAAASVWAGCLGDDGDKPNWSDFGDGQAASRTIATLSTIVN
jgi:UDP-GlcNAc3NAcA epimerase